MDETKRLPYGAQWIDDEDVAAVTQQLMDDWLTQGPRVLEFEAQLAAFVGARYAVAVANGTAALHIACLAAGVSWGDIALAPDITFVATANAVRYAGGRPQLIDVDPETGHIDIAQLERTCRELAAQGKAPKAILPVHFSGSTVDLVRIREIANRYGAKVIEDAAHALGATYAVDGQRFSAASCSHSDMAILSFHPVKHVTTGEGGAVTTNDPDVYEDLLELRSHGITRNPKRMRRADGPWYYEQRSLGYNYRITDFQCALGISQLRKLPRFLEIRRELAARYDVGFSSEEARKWVRPLRVPKESSSAYHLYVVRLVARAGETDVDVAKRRLALFEGLRARNIFPQVHYIPVHKQPSFEDAGLSGGSFAGADAYYAGCISLPMYPKMNHADVDRVVHTVLDLVSKA